MGYNKSHSKLKGKIPMEENKEGCTHDCSTCGENCSSRQSEDFSAPQNALSNIDRVIGVVSGKGGVGKSSVTAMLAVLFNRLGYSTAVLDADITGPSIPRLFGVGGGKVTGDEGGMIPPTTTSGIKLMSSNLLLPEETAPVIWRGPVVAGMIKQFWSDVVWGDVDYMFVDMPPGTGDVPLTVFQSLPVDGIVIVTTPQQLVSMIVEKAVNMAKMMKIPVLGLVENMSYIKCPDCGKEIPVFGESNIEEFAGKLNLDVLARMPIDSKISALCDRGMLEMMDIDYLDTAVTMIENRLKS